MSFLFFIHDPPSFLPLAFYLPFSSSCRSLSSYCGPDGKYFSRGNERGYGNRGARSGQRGFISELAHINTPASRADVLARVGQPSARGPQGVGDFDGNRISQRHLRNRRLKVTWVPRLFTSLVLCSRASVFRYDTLDYTWIFSLEYGCN